MTHDLERKFYNSKIEKLKDSNPRNWWKNMKSLLGIGKQDDLPFQSLANDLCDGEMDQLAEEMNTFFQSVGDHIAPLNAEDYPFSITCHVPDEMLISTDMMERHLSRVKTNKSAGPDNIPAWIYRDFCHILAAPMTSIVNSSLQEGHVPLMWKSADIVPIPKVRPMSSIQTDFRPISLTPIGSKVMEFFPCQEIYNSVVNKIDPSQYGGLRGSSTSMALMHMIDFMYKQTAKAGTYVHLLLCDFSKAFDLVDHTKLINKLNSLQVPECLVKWTASFLFQRQQRVKLGNIKSQALTPKTGCPQGTILGPLAFICQINDLHIPAPAITIKYVDDTSVLHASNKQNDPTIQKAANSISSWSRENNMRLNASKSKEMIIAFTKKDMQIPTTSIGEAVIERVSNAKILGLIISNDLTWNAHIDYLARKVNKRLYMLTRCKRAGVSKSDMLAIYRSLIRPVLEYCCAVWHTNLPQYLHDHIESFQRRVVKLICGFDLSYDQCLKELKIETLFDRRLAICKKFFKDISSPNHRLHSLLPARTERRRSKRTAPKFDPPRFRTSRYKNSFVPYSLSNFQ